MALRCVLSLDGEGVALHAQGCPLGVAGDSNGPACPWRDGEGLCRYQADRRDLMKSLSLLSTRVFELSRRDAIPAETMTDTCLLLDTARTLMEKCKQSKCDGQKR